VEACHTWRIATDVEVICGHPFSLTWAGTEIHPHGMILTSRKTSLIPGAQLTKARS
jgi:hypothetical protein